MKKFLLFVLCAVLCLSAFSACVDVDLENNSSSSDKDISAESSSADDTTEESVAYSKEESSEEYIPPVYTPIYPEDYTERVAYYTNYEVSADVNDAYFNDSVFVGNSIMLHYKNYITNGRTINNSLLGNASFFAAASFSFFNNKNQKADQADCAWPLYRGEKMNISTAVSQMNVKNVYLSLMALNDIAMYKDGITGVNETYNLVVELINELKTANPDLNVVIISNTYLHSSRNDMSKKLNNGSIHTFNTRVLDYCNQNGIDFVDVTYALVDDSGCLGTEFCSDAYCHLTTAAYSAWTEQLRDYAGKKQAGRWANPTELKGYNY